MPDTEYVPEVLNKATTLYRLADVKAASYTSSDGKRCLASRAARGERFKVVDASGSRYPVDIHEDVYRDLIRASSITDFTALEFFPAPTLDELTAGADVFVAGFRADADVPDVFRGATPHAFLRAPSRYGGEWRAMGSHWTTPFLGARLDLASVVVYDRRTA